MPILPPGQDPGQALGDLFGGVNRPQLNAFVATSQARNGLVSAQTQDALIKASQAQEQQEAWDQIPQQLIAANPDMKPSEALLTRAMMVGANNHDPEATMKAIAQSKLMFGDPASQTAGQQGYQGHIAGPVATPPDSQMPVGSQLATQPVNISPTGQAQIAQTKAMTGLDIARAEDEHHRAQGSTSPGTSLDPGTVDNGADVVMADPTKMASYAGFGQSGQNNKNAINNRIAQKLNAAGMNANDMIRQRAIAKASVGSTAQAAKQAETLDAFMPLVRANGDRINELLSQVGDDGADMPLLAGLQRSLGRNLGDNDLAELHSVFTTYQNEVSRLLAAGPSMNGVISDKARGEIQGMAPENMTTSQARQVINRVNTEMGIRRNSVQNAIESGANAQLPVTAPPPATAPLGAAPVPAAAGPSGGAPIPLDQYLKSKGY